MSSATPTGVPPSAAAGASAEAQAAAFASDPRIHFSRATGRWSFEDDDDNEFEYDVAKGVWVPVVDEELLKKQQAAYSIAGVDEEAPAAPVLARHNKKRKEYEEEPGPSIVIKRGKADKKGGKSETQPRKSKNTAVYVTGLPPDAELDEVVARFSKCGVLEEDYDGDPKVKLYARDDGTFSGDALVVYFKEESVALAVAMLDDAELRIGDTSTRMSVSQAEFGHKNGQNGEDGGGGGEGSSKPRKTMNKKKTTKRLGRMQKKLEEWGSDDDFGPTKDESDKSSAANKNNRVVVLKHMFTLKELEEDASLLLDLKEDVREECSTLGEVTNVVLYDEEPDGVMTVKFRDPLSAQACVLKMKGRFFSGRRVDAFLYDSKQRYKRSGTHDDLEGDSDAAEKKRLDDFAKWLMTEGD